MTTTSPATVPGVVRAAAREFADLEALNDGEDSWTFATLSTETDKIARALVASGLQPGDRVGIWGPNSARWVLVSLGVYAAGCTLVPLNTRFLIAEAEHIARTAEVSMLFVAPPFMGRDYPQLADDMATEMLREVVVLGPARAGATGWDEFRLRGDDMAHDVVPGREAAIDEHTVSDIIFTSGTTGAPKGAMLTHGASTATYRAWADRVGLRTHDRYLVVYPFFHTAGLKSGVLACLLTGATVVPLPVFNVATVLDTVVKQRISVLPGPPTIFQSILEDPALARADLASLRLSVVGAATVPVELVRRMRSELPFETIVTGYGLTETTGTISMCRHDDSPEVIATTVGRPLPGLEVKIARSRDRTDHDDAQGEILVRGYNLMQGYLGDSEATEEAIDSDGWLHTGDIGVVDDDGNLRITGRLKEMFIVGGFNAYPAEIEGMLLEHPALAQVAIVGLADHRLGEVGAAAVVTVAGTTVDVEELIGWCRTRMANYKVPRRIIILDELPLNASGKVLKTAVRDLFS